MCFVTIFCLTRVLYVLCGALFVSRCMSGCVCVCVSWLLVIFQVGAEILKLTMITISFPLLDCQIKTQPFITIFSRYVARCDAGGTERYGSRHGRETHTRRMGLGMHDSAV